MPRGPPSADAGDSHVFQRGISLFLIIATARLEGPKDRPEKPAALDYYFQRGTQSGRDNWASVESPPPCRPPSGPPERCDSQTHTHTHAHTHRLVPHSLFSKYLRAGRPLELLSLSEDCHFTCGLCAPPAEGGGSGIAQAPIWRKLELKSSRGVLGKFTLVCVCERDKVLPDTLAGQQVTRRWEGIADIPETFPIKISTLVLEPARWHVYVCAMTT